MYAEFWRVNQQGMVKYQGPLTGRMGVGGAGGAVTLLSFKKGRLMDGVARTQ